MVVDLAYTSDPHVRLCAGCGENLRYLVGRTWYSREALIEVQGVYDGGLFYAHPTQGGGCGFAWHRWPKGHHLRQRAEPYLAKWLERYGADTERR